MTTFEITFNTRDYAIRQQLQKAILARELMYHYGFENDYFYGDSERELTRQNREFTMYDNMLGTSDAINPTSGIYSIGEDDVIWGYYDNSGYTFWSHKYVISELTATSMVWTAADNPEDISVYTRIDSIPESVTGGSASDGQTGEADDIAGTGNNN